MNIDRFKDQHVQILSGIDTLRKLSHKGIEENALEISNELGALANVVIQHLAIEDRILYPSLERCGDPEMAQKSRIYQKDMEGIANSFIGFSRRWSKATELLKAPEKFRNEANLVLKKVYDRMLRENHDFYPEIEALSHAEPAAT